MIQFMSGAVTLGFLIAAVFFLNFWRRTADRLFLAFAIAFTLFGVNQFLAELLEVTSEPSSFIYGVRVIGFVVILAAIVDKNMHSTRGSGRRPGM